MKKLLLTIIILGACLVGSSQNWDSVKVGNLDVDSIMLGGVKIWEKQTSQDTIDWTYEGVMTVAYAFLDPNEEYGWAILFDENGDTSQEFGDISPDIGINGTPNGNVSLTNLISYDEGFEFNILYFGVEDGNNETLLTQDDILVQIDGINYTLVWSDYYGSHVHEFYPLSYRIFVENQTYNIKIKYTLAP